MINNLKEIKKIVEDANTVLISLVNTLYSDPYNQNRDLNKAEINLMIYRIGLLAGTLGRLNDNIKDLDIANPNNQRDGS